jgi:hypothetical protein
MRYISYLPLYTGYFHINQVYARFIPKKISLVGSRFAYSIHWSLPDQRQRETWRRKEEGNCENADPGWQPGRDRQVLDDCRKEDLYARTETMGE